MNAKRLFVVGLIAILLVVNVSVLINIGGQEKTAGGAASGANSGPTFVFPRANHDPIRINGNSDFDAAHGVTGGSGTESDPYLISGWVINIGSGGDGIYIGNTTKNFTIMNCELFNANGNFVNYHANAGVHLYNIKADKVVIENNRIYDNNGAGISIYKASVTNTLDSEISGNSIYYNGRAGVYISSVNGFSVLYNQIFNNGDAGVWLTGFSGTGTPIIYMNGFAYNAHEGVRIQSSSEVTIFRNVFYKNNGTTGTYDPTRYQASETSSSAVFWSNGMGNFWYDWAMANQTNYYESNFTLKWPYPVHGSSVYDLHPLKGIHMGALKVDWKGNGYDDNKTFTIDNGIIGGMGTKDSPYIISGWELNGTVPNGADSYIHLGYGLLLNNTFENNGDEKYISVDGLIIHDVAYGNSYPLNNGSGLVMNETNLGPSISNVTIYNCTESGIYVRGYTIGPIIKNSYIHHNNNGIYVGMSAYAPADVRIENSTMASNANAGAYISVVTTEDDPYGASFMNDIFSENKYGLFVNYISGYVSSALVNDSSFFKNTQEAIRTVADGVVVACNNSVFYENNNSGSVYIPERNQIAIHSNAQWGLNNMFYDMPSGGEYPAYNGASSSKYEKAVRWIDFDRPVHIDESTIGYAMYRGTLYGVAGYDDSSKTIYIIGLHPTTNYAPSPLYINHRIYVSVSSEYSIDIENVNASDSGDGIEVAGANMVTIKNSVAYNNKYVGMYLNYGRGFSIKNNEILKNYNGLEVQGSDNNLNMISYNRIYRNTNFGIYISSLNTGLLGTSINNNQIFGNDMGIKMAGTTKTIIEANGIAYNTHYGVYLTGDTTNNHIYGNIFFKNNNTGSLPAAEYVQAYDAGTNFWNDTNKRGNYWYDICSHRGNDEDHNGIVDYSYNIDGGAADNYPITEKTHNAVRIDGVRDLDIDHGVIGGDGSSEYPYAIVGWGIYEKNTGDGIYIGNITESVHLRIAGVTINRTAGSTDTYHHASALEFYNVKSTELDVKYFYAENNTGDGIYGDTVSNLTIWDSYFNHNAHGIKLLHATHVLIMTNNISNSVYSGMAIYSSSDLSFYLDTIYHNGYYGLYIDSSTDDPSDNYVAECTFRLNAQYGVYLTSSSGFKIYKNTFDRNNGASGTGAFDTAHLQAYDDASTEYTNLWNTTTDGNCWSDYTGTGAYPIDGGQDRDEKPSYCGGTVPELSNYALLIIAMLGMVLLRWRRH